MSEFNVLNKKYLRTTPLTESDLRKADSIVVYHFKPQKGGLDEYLIRYAIDQKVPDYVAITTLDVSSDNSYSTNNWRDYQYITHALNRINESIANRNNRDALQPYGVQTYYYPKGCEKKVDSAFLKIIPKKYSEESESHRLYTQKGYKTAVYGRKGHRDAITQLENSVRNMF